MERLCHLTNKMYREMLYITRHDGMEYITMGPGGLDDVQTSAFTGIPHCPQYRISLSWDLLDQILVEGRILCSFTNFITTPELSGPLHISPDIYHTQVTEYSLQHFQSALFFLHKHLPNIYIYLDPTSFTIAIMVSDRAGPLQGNTFRVLIQLKWFFIYSDQFV